MAENEIFQDSIRYVPAKVAATRVGLDPYDVSRFCREGLVIATRHRGQWYVHEQSLDTFLASQAQQRDEHNRKLAEEVQREVRQAAERPSTTPIGVMPHPRLQEYRTAVARNRARKSLATIFATITLVASLGSAFALTSDADAFAAVSDHVASARAALTDDIGFARDAAHTQLAAAGASGFTQWIGELLFALFGDQSEPNAPASPPPTTPQPAQAEQTTTSQLVNTPPPSKPVPASASTPPKSAYNSPNIRELANTGTPAPTPPAPKITERVIETVRTVVESGVNAAYVDERLAAIQQSLQSQLAAVAASSHNESTTIYQTLGAVARIENLDDINLDDSDITNSRIVGGSISGATISGDITATDFSGVLAIAKGGTGTSNAPTYGKVLLGNSSGTYDLVATSSLGIVSNSGADFGQAFELANDALSPTTTVGLIISASSTFNGGVSFDRSTTTNATSTNFFATLGRFTTAIADVLTATAATITNLTATTITATNATTTRLDALDYVAVGRTATTTIRGDGVASTIPYASTTVISVSGLSFLNGGLLSLASTTIGSGTQAGGLTISGGATTTGTLYVAGNVGVGVTSPAYSIDASGDIRGAVLRAQTGIASSGYILAGSTVLNYNGTFGLKLAGPQVEWTGGGSVDSASDVGIGRYAASILKITDGSTGNGGLLALASTTIGAGGQTTGLTISGGATTTGNAYFASSVGIGTASPTNALDISGGAGGVTARVVTTGSNTDAFFTAQNSNATVSFGVPNSLGTIRYGGISVLTFTSTGVSINDAAGPGANVGLLVGTGNVGIGTTSPYAKLSVVGETVASHFTATSSTASLFTGGLLSLASTTIGAGGQTTGLTISGGATTTGNAYFAGNLGIGTVSPSNAKLSILGTANSYDATIRLQRATDSYLSYLQFVNSSGFGKWAVGYTGGAAGFPSNDDFAIWEDESPSGTRFFIKAGGNVGIGTTTPGSRLSVTTGLSVGANYGVAAPSNGAIIEGSVGIGTTSPYAKLSVVGPVVAEYFHATSSNATSTFMGGFGVGTSTPWRTLSVNGTVGLAGLTAAEAGSVLCLSADNEVTTDATPASPCSSSLLANKTNIVDLTEGLDAVLRLRPVEFDWKEGFGRGHELGFIAEEVQDAAPILADYNPDGSLGSVKYTQVGALLTKAIQELASITGTFKANLISWLANAANGIGDFFARRVHTQELCTTRSDGTEVCASGDQLAALLSASAAAAGAPNATGGGLEAPASTPVQEATPADAGATTTPSAPAPSTSAASSTPDAPAAANDNLPAQAGEPAASDSEPHDVEQLAPQDDSVEQEPVDQVPVEEPAAMTEEPAAQPANDNTPVELQEAI